MVEDTLDDGKRIAQLLASEIEGHERPPLGSLSVENADRDAEPSLDGTLAYEIAADGETVAEVYIHDDRARVEVRTALDAAERAARDAGLRTRPKAVEPPRLLVFVESGAAVKRALPVLRALADE
jgi:hypothetical protein